MHLAVGNLFDNNKRNTKFNIRIDNLEKEKEELLEEKDALEMKVAHLVNDKFKLSIDLKLVADEISKQKKNSF